MKICISAEVNSNLNLIMQITTQGHDLWSKYKQRASEGALKTAITSLIFHDFGKIIPVMNFQLEIEDWGYTKTYTKSLYRHDWYW